MYKQLTYSLIEYGVQIVALIPDKFQINLPIRIVFALSRPEHAREGSVVYERSICLLVYASDWRLPPALEAVRRKLCAGIRGECLQSAYKIASSCYYHSNKTARALKTYLTGRYGRLSLRARSIFS